MNQPQHFFSISGADITDYFNYGFTEETWQAYCQRQRRIRLGESGAGLPLPPGVTALPPGGGLKPAITTHPSVIPTLGGGGLKGGDKLDTTKPPPVPAAPAAPDVPTAISVMTSDKRTYSKKVMDGPPPPTIDFSVPPPGMAGQAFFWVHTFAFVLCRLRCAVVLEIYFLSTP